jgi:DNA-directed RNA polymerase subunit RPC12/RpoP
VETRLVCVNCGNHFLIDGRADDDLDQEIECPNCGWTCSIFCFIGEEENNGV